MTNGPAVAQMIPLQMITGYGTQETFRGTFGYLASDPFAVTVLFQSKTIPGLSVEWVFARDLLVDGLLAEVGDGDVRVMLAVRDHRKMTVLVLQSPYGVGVLETPTSGISGFLERTAVLVPYGCESAVCDMDAVLVGLGVS